MRVIANLDLLARVANFTSTDGTRFYLQGVTVDCTKLAPVLVATDGRVMGCWRDPGASVSGTVAAAVNPCPIITAATILAAMKGTAKSKDATLWLVIDGDTKDATAVVKSGTTPEHKDAVQVWRAPQDSGHLIDGTFPDWRRVLPGVDPSDKDKALDTSPILNAADLGRFLKAARSPGKSGAAWVQVTGAGHRDPQVITAALHPDFLGVVAPATRNVGTPQDRTEVAAHVRSFGRAV